jgi:hypothetical protein
LNGRLLDEWLRLEVQVLHLVHWGPGMARSSVVVATSF